MGELFADRARAGSFGSVAAEYDRFRPSYPVALVDDLVAPQPRSVLDVGCGTGKAAVLLADRGLEVLGVEADERMAQVARAQGLRVETAAFETWQPDGRRFDLITCGQAWHWIDPDIGIAKAAALLQPGGTLALFWNYDEIDEPARSAIDAAYAEYAPELIKTRPLGDDRTNDRPHARALAASELFASVESRAYPWAITRSATEWIAMTATHSDHLLLDDVRRGRLLIAIGVAIVAGGDSVTSRYSTHAVIARR